ncbi:hypothetical protein BAS10_02510 [Elizabethkingia meningoseptica]|nr:hypothetical protein BAS10_02510 [Elizabethkingia meningoseptica]
MLNKNYYPANNNILNKTQKNTSLFEKIFIEINTSPKFFPTKKGSENNFGTFFQPYIFFFLEKLFSDDIL